MRKLAVRNDAWWVIGHEPSATFAATSPNAVLLMLLTSPKPALTYDGFSRMSPTAVKASAIGLSVNFTEPSTHWS